MPRGFTYTEGYFVLFFSVGGEALVLRQQQGAAPALPQRSRGPKTWANLCCPPRPLAQVRSEAKQLGLEAMLI